MIELALRPGPALGPPSRGYSDHVRVHGPLPTIDARLVETLEQSHLLGRGGAAFPVGAKWKAVLSQKQTPVILANGAEGEPLSDKDRFLVETRPHLLIDGALAAGWALGAGRVVFYLDGRSIPSFRRALDERTDASGFAVSIVRAPHRFIAGEETAAIHCVNDNLALPLTKPPRPYQRGVAGQPTLVQNVESLAYAGLIARYGAEWFRNLGAGESPGSLLITLSGAVHTPGVTEVPAGTSVGEVIDGMGGYPGHPSAILLGGYFGGWIDARLARDLPLDPISLRARGVALGCGVIHVLPEGACGVAETAKVIEYLASESARQCGPCVFGLRALADVMTALASGEAGSEDLGLIQRWSGDIRGRGACAHPDGAASFLQSALHTFPDAFRVHQARLRCATCS